MSYLFVSAPGAKVIGAPFGSSSARGTMIFGLVRLRYDHKGA